MFDHLHPEDVEKVREQLSTQEPQNSGRILDLKTGTVKKEGHQCKSIINIISCYSIQYLISIITLKFGVLYSFDETVYGFSAWIHLSNENR